MNENEEALLKKYPLHILLQVKAAKKALEEGRARIEDNVLIFSPPDLPGMNVNSGSRVTVSGGVLDLACHRNVRS